MDKFVLSKYDISANTLMQSKIADEQKQKTKLLHFWRQCLYKCIFVWGIIWATVPKK